MNSIDTIEDFGFLNYNFAELQEHNLRQQEKIDQLETEVEFLRSDLRSEVEYLQLSLDSLEARMSDLQGSAG